MWQSIFRLSWAAGNKAENAGAAGNTAVVNSRPIVIDIVVAVAGRHSDCDSTRFLLLSNQAIRQCAPNL